MKNFHNITEIEKKLDSLSLIDKENKVLLPENIREEIQKNISELKEWLNNELEFAHHLIIGVCHIANHPPGVVVGEVYNHYADIIALCRQKYEVWPPKITRIEKIVNLLCNLVEGNDLLIIEAAKSINSSWSYDDCAVLSDLVRLEICQQFDPEGDYKYPYDQDPYHLLGDSSNTEFDI